MTNPRETRTYVREGRHNRGIDVTGEHTIFFATSALRREGLDHLASAYARSLPLTVVKTDCPVTHGTLEAQGYQRIEGRKTIPMPYHENLF